MTALLSFRPSKAKGDIQEVDLSLYYAWIPAFAGMTAVQLPETLQMIAVILIPTVVSPLQGSIFIPFCTIN
jgi:hypothetical protein